jgi:hypothetical protein
MRVTVALTCLACAIAGTAAAGAESPAHRAAAGAESPAHRAAASGLILYWSDSPWPSIWSVRPDGSRRHRLFRTRQNAKRPVLSPDRQWVAFDGAPPGKPPLSDFDIQVVRRDGTGRWRLPAGSSSTRNGRRTEVS